MDNSVYISISNCLDLSDRDRQIDGDQPQKKIMLYNQTLYDLRNKFSSGQYLAIYGENIRKMKERDRLLKGICENLH